MICRERRKRWGERSLESETKREKKEEKRREDLNKKINLSFTFSNLEWYCSSMSNFWVFRISYVSGFLVFGVSNSI